MLEIARTFEQYAARLNSIALAASGLVLLLTGLFLWLGGLRFRKILFAVIGAACGIAFGFFVSGWNILLAVAMIGLAAFFAVKLDDIFIAVVASVLATVVGFTYLISPYIKGSEDLFPLMQQAVIDVPYYNWALLLLLIIIPIIGKFYFPSLTTALVCSAMGTFITAAGITLLALSTGNTLSRHIAQKYTLSLALFCGLIALGTLEQLFLVRTVKVLKGPKVTKIKPKKKKDLTKNSKKHKGKNAGQDETQQTRTASWRTA